MGSLIFDVVSKISAKVFDFLDSVRGAIIYNYAQPFQLEGALLRGLVTGISLSVSIYVINQTYSTLFSFSGRSKSNSSNQSHDDSDTAAQININHRKHTKERNIIEISVYDIESIENCRDSGCDSIEICCNRAVGGITPSIGLVEQAVQILKSTDIEIHVLIRPRPGNFNYSHNEFDVILRDIIAFKQLGIDGVVVGVLQSNGEVDKARLQVLRSVSQGIKLTFHRAFDVCSDYIHGLDTIIEAECDRLLTSGRASCAGSTEGVNTLLAISERVNNRLQIIAGGGVHKGNGEDILAFAGVHGIHVGSAVTTLRTFTSLHTCSAGNDDVDIALSLSEGIDLHTWSITDACLVKDLVDSLATATDQETTPWRHVDSTPVKPINPNHSLSTLSPPLETSQQEEDHHVDNIASSNIHTAGKPINTSLDSDDNVRGEVPINEASDAMSSDHLSHRVCSIGEPLISHTPDTPVHHATSTLQRLPDKGTPRRPARTYSLSQALLTPLGASPTAPQESLGHTLPSSQTSTALSHTHSTAPEATDPHQLCDTKPLIEATGLVDTTESHVRHTVPVPSCSESSESHIAGDDCPSHAFVSECDD